MKIKSLEVLTCDAGWRPWIYLKMVTDEGLIGWSEITDSHGSPKGLRGIIEDLSPLVVGKEPRPERIYWDLYQATRQAPGGLIAKAIGGIENALWDIKGKQLGVPVYELFGGPTRDEIPCYWSHCGTTRARYLKDLPTYESVMNLAVEVENKGFSALKTNIVVPGKNPMVLHPGFGGGPADGNCTEKIVCLLKNLVSAFHQADVDVILDLNFDFKPEGVVRIARELDDLLWLEVDCYSPEALADIRSKSPVPICSGEDLYGARAYKPYFDRGAVSIASVDVVWNGFGQAKKIADLAEIHEVNVTPHNYYSHLATFMSAQFCAAIPNVRMLEVDVDDVPWKDELTNVPVIEYGNMSVPLGPGWGCNVNEKVLAEHVWNK